MFKYMTTEISGGLSGMKPFARAVAILRRVPYIPETKPSNCEYQNHVGFEAADVGSFSKKEKDNVFS